MIFTFEFKIRSFHLSHSQFAAFENDYKRKVSLE